MKPSSNELLLLAFLCACALCIWFCGVTVGSTRNKTFHCNFTTNEQWTCTR